MAQKLQQQLKELGSKLENPPASKDALIKLVKQGATCLSEIGQTPPKSLLDSMQPFLNAIVKPELLKHQDREVKLFVASCVCEITQITAPKAPYDDDALKDIFQLIVSTLSGLTDINSPSFGRRFVILETLAKYRLCVVMLDLECDDLINEMFNTFFAVASDNHPENVLIYMQKIMEVVLDESEDVPENLLHIILSILGRDKEDITLAARRLAMNVIESCAAKLEPNIKQFLVSSISGDNWPTKSEINYRGVLYNIYRCAPQILSGVVPYLTGELRSDQLDIRLKAVRLVGDLFALPGCTISKAFKPVFLEFLKRLTDRLVEVRMSVLEYVRTCLLENPVRAEAPEIISALCDRLMDYDENVRKQVVSVICDVACHVLTSISVETVKMVSERLRDKSLLVKRYTMERLADIYRVSCMKQSSGSTKDDEYDWIVGKILRCFYDKDFRSDTIEPVVSLSLFPADFSVEDKVKIWRSVFSGFDKVEVKALEKILEQKQRQLDMFPSILVHGEADGKSDTGVSRDKESISLLNSILLWIRDSEDALDTAKFKNLYATTNDADDLDNSVPLSPMQSSTNEGRHKKKKRKQNVDNVSLMDIAAVIGNEIAKASEVLSKAIEGIDVAISEKRQKVNSEVRKIPHLTTAEIVRVVCRIVQNHELIDAFFNMNDEEKEEMAKAIIQGDI